MRTCQKIGGLGLELKTQLACAVVPPPPPTYFSYIPYTWWSAQVYETDPNITTAN